MCCWCQTRCVACGRHGPWALLPTTCRRHFARGAACWPPPAPRCAPATARAPPRRRRPSARRCRCCRHRRRCRYRGRCRSASTHACGRRGTRPTPSPAAAAWRRRQRRDWRRRAGRRHGRRRRRRCCCRRCRSAQRQRSPATAAPPTCRAPGGPPAPAVPCGRTCRTARPPRRRPRCGRCTSGTPTPSCRGRVRGEPSVWGCEDGAGARAARRARKQLNKTFTERFVRLNKTRRSKVGSRVNVAAAAKTDTNRHYRAARFPPRLTTNGHYYCLVGEQSVPRICAVSINSITATLRALRASRTHPPRPVRLDLLLPHSPRCRCRHHCRRHGAPLRPRALPAGAHLRPDLGDAGALLRRLWRRHVCGLRRDWRRLAAAHDRDGRVLRRCVPGPRGRWWVARGAGGGKGGALRLPD